MTDASERILLHLDVIKGGISRIDVLPRSSAAVVIGSSTLCVSSPSAEKQHAQSSHFEQ